MMPDSPNLAPALSLRSILYLALAILLTVGVSVSGAIFTDHSMPWYGATLKRPWFNPPTLAFPIAWSILFALMAFCFWRILRLTPGLPGRSRAILAFLVQLALNALWSFIFFGRQDPATALLEVVCFLTAIIFMIVSYRRVDTLSAKLMWPYAAWVSFATLLNLAIVVLNPEVRTLWNGL